MNLNASLKFKESTSSTGYSALNVVHLVIITIIVIFSSIANHQNQCNWNGKQGNVNCRQWNVFVLCEVNYRLYSKLVGYIIPQYVIENVLYSFGEEDYMQRNAQAGTSLRLVLTDRTSSHQLWSAHWLQSIALGVDWSFVPGFNYKDKLRHHRQWM